MGRSIIKGTGYSNKSSIKAIPKFGFKKKETSQKFKDNILKLKRGQDLLKKYIN